MRRRIANGGNGGGAVRAGASSGAISAQGATGRNATIIGPVATVTRADAGAPGPSGAAMQQFSGGADLRVSGQHSWQSAGADGAQAAASGVLVTTKRPSIIARTTRST